MGTGTARRWAWAAYSLGGLAATFAYFRIDGLLALNLAYDGIGLSSVVAIVLGVRLFRPSRAVAWYLLALGQLAFVAGDVVWSVLEVAGEVPFPSAADVAYLSGYPFVAAGALALVGSGRSKAERTALLDAGIVAVGAGLLSWVFFVGPQVDDGALGLLGLGAAAAYPLGDVLVLSVVARLALAPRPPSPALGLLGAGLLALLAADVAFAVLAASGGYSSGHPVDTGWLLSYVLLGAAALHPSMRSLSEPTPPVEGRVGWLRVATLAGAGLLSPVALWLQARRGVGPEDAFVLAVGWAAMTVLVLLRLAGLLRDVQAQADALQTREAELATALGDLRRVEGERRRLLERALRAAEEERMSLALDLHDGPVQRLAELGFTLERARMRVEDGQRAQALALLRQVADGLRAELAGLRRLMASLRPPALDAQGLAGALRDHVRAWGERTGIPCELQVDLECRPAPELETVMYRVVQEALANVAKHAAARRVLVRVSGADGLVRLEVRDDGRGFDPRRAPELAAEGHFGLLAMREQVRMAGGRWEVESRPGAGTAVRATFGPGSPS
jgi:signal transduction histidine kinase